MQTVGKLRTANLVDSGGFRGRLANMAVKAGFKNLGF